MSNLSPDVITEVLARLPVKSLLRFKTVSKGWYALINRPDFIKLHHNQAVTNNNLSFFLLNYYTSALFTLHHQSGESVTIDFPYTNYTIKIIGSCRGLICMSVFFQNNSVDLFLLNPSTKQLKPLPSLNIQHQIVPHRPRPIQFHGLGYDQYFDDYIVILILLITSINGLTREVVYLYSLKTNSWTNFQIMPVFSNPIADQREEEEAAVPAAAGVYVNGGLHWVIDQAIVCYDIVNEEFKNLAGPDFGNDMYEMSVGVLGGCLYVLAVFYNFQVEVWMMKEYGKKQSWEKHFIYYQTVQDIHCRLKPFGFSMNGDAFLFNNMWELFRYDPKTHTAESLKYQCVPSHFEVQTFAGSLVSLKSTTASMDTTNQNKRRRIQG